jgi:hypothetical protein
MLKNLQDFNMEKEPAYYVKFKDNDNIEVVIKPTFDGYVMHHSTSEQWSPPMRGEEIMRVSDNGDGFIFKWKETRKRGQYDYSQASYLAIMLDFLNRKSHAPSHYLYLTIDPTMG